MPGGFWDQLADPVGPAKGLFSKKFFLNCKRILKQRGILVAQGESPKFNESVFVELNTTFQEIFGVEKTKLLRSTKSANSSFSA